MSFGFSLHGRRVSSGLRVSGLAESHSNLLSTMLLVEAMISFLLAFFDEKSQEEGLKAMAHKRKAIKRIANSEFALEASRSCLG